MKLTRKQEEGLKIAIDRWKAGEKYTVISGYAGTGKSTLVKFIIDAMNIPEEKIRYIAYTGKAANVLKNKGNKGAMTAHKLLMNAKIRPDGKYNYIPREHLEGYPMVVVVDEVSMLPIDLWLLLLRHDIYIIACGDPGQLPPVADNPNKDPNNHVLDHPHIFLDEVMRQAQESEIIRLSMHVRDGKSLLTFPFSSSSDEVHLIRKADLTLDDLNQVNQVLCASNTTKAYLNKAMRKSQGREGPPQVGDKVINKKNDWECYSNKGNALTNGVIGYIQEDLYQDTWQMPWYVKKKYFNLPIGVCSISGDEEGEFFRSLIWDYNMLSNYEKEPTLTGEEKFRLLKRRSGFYIPHELEYGYAITVWKAQGSEWEHILLLQENHWPRDPVAKEQYLYTGITRAIRELTLVVE